MSQKNISTREVSDYLQVPYQTLAVWIGEGILGNHLVSPGRGKGRKFSLEDVAAARVAKDVMTFVGDLSVARDCVRVFRQGSTEKDFDLAVQLVQDHWSIFWSRPGLSWGEVTTLVMPVKKIVEEIRGIFKAELVKG